MKIGLVSPAVYPVRGGVELHVYNLARGLMRAGHQVHVFTRDVVPHNGSSPIPVHDGIPLWRLPAILRHYDLDLLHVHGARSVFSSTALATAAASGVPTVFTPHCFNPATEWKGVLKRALFDPTLGNLAIQCSKAIVCLTPNDASDAVRLGALERQIQVIPNSIYLPVEQPAERVRQWKARHGFDRYLLSVGRLHSVKRGDFLVRAMADLQGLQLVFIGPDRGAAREWRQAAAEIGVAERVIFAGEVPNEDLQLAYQGCLACVMASRYEGLPTVLLEAMALGAPVIAAETGGIPHLVQHRQTGWLYRYEDMASFCCCVADVIHSDTSEITAAARRKVQQDYSWDENVPRVIRLYEEVGARTAPRR